MNNKASRSGASGKARSNQGQDRDPAQEAPLSSPLTTDDASARLLALLARNIRQLRGQRAMTRKGLAAQSGVSLPHLARLESSQGNVSVVILDKVARALNVPVSALFAEEQQLGGDLGIIIELLKRRPAEQLAALRERLFSEFEPGQVGRSGRIALIGLRGAGKSTVGQELAQRLNRPFIELNREVEREAGISLQEIINFYGQAGYRNIERRCLERLVATHPEVVLATGGGLVAEAPTYEILLSSFFTVWLHADPETHFRRVMAQHDIRIAKPTLYREAMDNILRTLDARDHLYRLASLDLDTTPLTVAQVVDLIAQRISVAPTK